LAGVRIKYGRGADRGDIVKKNDLLKYFKSGRALVAQEMYAIVRARRACAGAFAVIRDRNETSCVIEESKLRNQKFLGIEGRWRLITFDMILPFGLIGFIAQVSGALADENISLLVISAYSTDHILIKDKDLDRTVKALEKLGFSVHRL
jgi:hypothetical protein